MNSGKKERPEKLVIALAKDQGQKSTMTVQKRNGSKKKPEENNDQEADKNEEIHQSQ
jgi:hypothetical protein